MAKASFNEPNLVPNIAGWHDVPPLSSVVQKNLSCMLDDTDDKETLQIILRLKPSHQDSQEETFKIIDGKTIQAKPPINSATFKNNRSGSSDEARYIFSQVLGEDTSQKTLFDACVLNHVYNFINGKNCLLFSYGTTNAGKTYTILGTKRNPGIIPRILSILFRSIQAKQSDELEGTRYRPEFGNAIRELNKDEIHEQILMKDKILNHSSDESKDLYHSAVMQLSEVLSRLSSNESIQTEFSEMQELINDESISVEGHGNVVFSVWVSFLEVYNEAVYDLLEPPKDKRIPLKISQDKSKNYFVKGLKHIHVRSGDEAYKVLLYGKSNLQVASTNLNRASSRSHCVFSIKLIKHDAEESISNATLSSFSICDLAGAERPKKAGNIGCRMKETQSINSSLHVLSRCFRIMLENQMRGSKVAPEVIPYRDSKLTQLFHRPLSGKYSEDITMIVNVNPSPILFDETVYILKASAIARQIIKKQPKLKNKRKSVFSTIVYESKQTDIISWDDFDEYDENVTTSKIDQLKEEFEREKLRIREECEEERLKSCQQLCDMMDEMAEEHKEQIDELREIYQNERQRRERVNQSYISKLKAEIERLKEGKEKGDLCYDSAFGSSFNPELGSSLQREIENLERSLSKVMEEKETLRTEVVSLKSANKDLNDMIRSAEKESKKVEALKQEVESMKKSNEKLKSLLEEARVDLLQADDEKNHLQKTIDSLEDKNSDLESQIEDLKLDLVNKDQLIDSLEKDVLNKDQTIDTLENELDDLRRQYESETISQERVMTEIEKERDTHLLKKIELENDINLLTNQLSSLEIKIKGVQNEKEEKCKKYKELVKNYEEKLEEANKLIDKQKKSAHLNLSEIEETYKKKIKQVEEQREEWKRIASNVENQKKESRTRKKLIEFENNENAPRTEPKRRLRTRNQIKASEKSPIGIRRSKSSCDLRVLGTQNFNTSMMNKTPSPDAMAFNDSDEVFEKKTKSCRKKFFNPQDFIDNPDEPVFLNPPICSSPSSELKSVKRRLRNK